MKIRVIDMIDTARNYENKLVVVRDNSTEAVLFKGWAKDTPFKVLRLEVTEWHTFEEYLVFAVDTGEEKVYNYSVYFMEDNAVISVQARNEAEAVEIGNNLNWKDGKKRTVKTVERW